MTSIHPLCLYRPIDEPLYLLENGNIRADSECFAAPAVEVAGQGLDAIHAPGAQHDSRALRGKLTSCSLAQPAARVRDDDDLCFQVFAHGELNPRGFQCGKHAVVPERDSADANAGRVVDCVGDGRKHWFE